MGAAPMAGNCGPAAGSAVASPGAGSAAPGVAPGRVGVALAELVKLVAAAPGLTAEQKAAVTADIDKMVNSAGWKSVLETKGWADTYLAGADFDAQLAKDIETTTAILKDIGLVK